MLALSFIPCGDGGGGIVELANNFFEIEYQQTSNHTQHSKDCGDDTCSPFCICSCCSTSINAPANINYTDKYIALFPQNLISYKSDFHFSNFNSSIWQPPKFS